MLTRVLKVTDEGLQYEADPRHVELLQRCLKESKTNSVSTPGNKIEEDLDQVINDEDAAEDFLLVDADDEPEDSADHSIQKEISYNNVLAIHDADCPQPRVTFAEPVAECTYHVVPYSQIFDIHPNRIVSTNRGFKLVTENVDPFYMEISSGYGGKKEKRLLRCRTVGKLEETTC